MVRFSQTSWFAGEKEDALHLLQHVPIRVNLHETPLLHYHAPQGFQAGATVRYRLISGLRRLDWTGVISSVSGTAVTVRLDLGPFRGFDARHTFLREDGIFTCHDVLSFQGEDIAFKAAVEKADMLYAFESRRHTAQLLLAAEAERETHQFQAFNQGMCAG
jgi:hypothetical protein